MWKKSRWPRRRQAEFFSRLGRLLENGFDLKHALDLIGRSMPQWRTDLSHVLTALEAGQSLRQSIAPFVHPSIIEELLLVELHGQQVAFLNLLGQRERRRIQYWKKFWQLTSYPIFLGGLLLVMTLYFMQQIPQVNLQAWYIAGIGGLALGLGIGGIYVCAYLHKMHWLICLPYVGALWRLSIQAQLCFQMGCLLQAGLKITDIIQFFNVNESNFKQQSYQYINHAVIMALRLGLPLPEALKFMEILPKEVQTLFQNGQTSEEIGYELIILSEDLAQTLKQKLLVCLQLLQPILFIFLAIGIVMIYCDFLLPTYQDFGEVTP